MNKSEFLIVLPSDSSMNYFPNNSAAHYTTMLPDHIKLDGEWVVALKEIQFPASFLHIQTKKEGEITLIKSKQVEEGVNHDSYVNYYFPPGLYMNQNQFIAALNDFLPTFNHFSFDINQSGFTTVKRVCSAPYCENTSHRLLLPDTLLDILGFDRYINKSTKEKYLMGNRNGRSYEVTHISKRPFSLIRGLPNSLFIYSDICTPYATGDVNSSLLRLVTLDTSSYSYGMTVTNTYGAPNYIPVLSNSFRTIKIDKRDNYGEPAPFEYGPLNVTLHFKRIN